MIDLEEDIQSLTDFKRNTGSFVDRMRETGRPVVLTVNGKAELVVQDARSYQRLLLLVEQAETITGIRRGLESVRRGEGREAAEVFSEIRHKKARPKRR